MHNILAVLCFASISQSWELLFVSFCQVQMKTNQPDYWWSQRKGSNLQNYILIPVVSPTLRNSSMPGAVSRVHSSLMQEGGRVLPVTPQAWANKHFLDGSGVNTDQHLFLRDFLDVGPLFQRPSCVLCWLLPRARGYIYLICIDACLASIVLMQRSFETMTTSIPKQKEPEEWLRAACLPPIQHPTTLFSTPWRPSHITIVLDYANMLKKLLLSNHMITGITHIRSFSPSDLQFQWYPFSQAIFTSFILWYCLSNETSSV